MGYWKRSQVNHCILIELIPGATPVYRQPYPVLQVHLETFKKKLRSFSRHWSTNPSERHRKGFANFFCAKKGWYRRWVWDIRELNNVVKRTQYTLPIITNVLRRRKGYEFLTKLDTSMMFYTFALDEEAQKMCAIVTPFGPFKYNKVPMGLVNSPAFA